MSMSYLGGAFSNVINNAKNNNGILKCSTKNHASKIVNDSNSIKNIDGTVAKDIEVKK